MSSDRSVSVTAAEGWLKCMLSLLGRIATAIESLDLSGLVGKSFLACVQCMAEVSRLESCKAEVMRRLIKDKWSDVEAVCAASHLVTPTIPAMYDAAVSTDRVPNGGQVMHNW